MDTSGEFSECENCGTQYRQEAMKQMLTEITGHVEVSGTVKIDSRNRLDNLYQAARRARDDNNSELAKKHYEMILVEDPNSWEAAFYAVYFQSMQCTIANIASAATAITNSIASTLSLIKCNISDSTGQGKALNEIVASVGLIGDMLHNAAISHYNEFPNIDSARPDYRQRAIAISSMFFILGDTVLSGFKNSGMIKTWAVKAYKQGISVICWYSWMKSECREIIESHVSKIHDIGDTSYQAPKSSEGLCFIATAVYGSYEAPEVRTLRHFRDEVLLKSNAGRKFVSFYYRHSPYYAEKLKSHKHINRIARFILDGIVALLEKAY
jgi:hypothetical protein